MRIKILLGLIFFLYFSFFPIYASETPNLVSPSSGTTTDDASPTLTWNWTGSCTTSGSCFRAEVDDNLNFSSAKYRYTSNTYYSPELGVGTWYWRVKAKDANNNWSDWSAVWNFTIVQSSSQTTAPIPIPTLAPTSTPTSSNLKISLSEIYPSPETGGKEWVEVYNPNDQNLDISGWKFQDGAGTKKNLEGSIRAYSFVFFEYPSGWLNNGGDTLNLLDQNGTIVESYTYGDTEKGIAWAKESGGSWQQTSTPTPGAANQISRPQEESVGTTTKSSKKTSSTTEKEAPKSESKEPAQSTAKTTSQGQVLSLREATLPALFDATPQGSLPEATSEASVKSSKINPIGVAFLILAGGILLGSAAFRFWKTRK